MFSKTMIITAVMAFASSVAASAGDMTYFNPGLGACGWTDNDGSAVVALNPADYASGKNCGRWIAIQGNGKSTRARVVDLCPGCRTGDIDVSPTVFDDIAALGVGRLKVTWNFE